MAIENGVQNAELGYILDPAFQIEGLNGKPVIGGWICIYEAGTDNKYISYENFDGAHNPFKVPLKSDGRAVILGDPSLSYDIYAFDSYGNLLFSRLNVQCNVPGTINLSGADTRLKNTDGTLDISLQTIGNNVREYTVNTRNKTLDVQEPLYFVENSESATIIGCRSQTGDYATTAYVESAVSSKLDISSYSSQSGNFLTDKFEYDNSNHITAYNNSAFAGTEYEAGDNIDITNNRISVTGLPTDSDVENAISSAVTNVENKFEYNTNNYITAYNNSAFAGKEYSAGDYVSIENDTINVTGLQPSGDYATKTELESATSGKQDTLSAGDGISIVNNTISVTSQGGGIEQVSHNDTLSGNGNDEPLGIANIEDFVKQNDLTAYQEKGDYYSASNPSGFITNDALTGLQPSGDYATHDDLTGYATTSLVSSVSSELYSAVSSISGDYELIAGSGVELVDDPNAKTTTINVTAEGGNPEVENLVTANSATWNTVSDKLDTTAFSTVSSDFLTAIPESALSGFADYSAISAKLAPEDVVVFIYGKQSAAYPYILSAYSAGKLCFAKYEHDKAYYQLLTCQSANTAWGAYSGYNRATFGRLRAGSTSQSLWQDTVTTADLSLLFVDGASDKSGNPGWNYGWTNNFFTLQAAGKYYSASNPSGFISEVPDTYLQNTDLATTDGKVTAISGIPLSAGGEVPEDVMVESAIGYNAVGEISSYGNSAIAQYGAEKQWLVHDDTLVHASNSAQYALGVNLSAVAQLLGVDETVLWSGSIGFGNSATLNESIQNFKQVKFRWKDWASTQTIHYDTFGIQNGIGSYYSIVGGWHGNTSANIVLFKLNLHDNGSTTMSFDQGVFMATTATTVNPANETKIEQIIGIGRKQ